MGFVLKFTVGVKNRHMARLAVFAHAFNFNIIILAIVRNTSPIPLSTRQNLPPVARKRLKFNYYSVALKPAVDFHCIRKTA